MALKVGFGGSTSLDRVSVRRPRGLRSRTVAPFGVRSPDVRGVGRGPFSRPLSLSGGGGNGGGVFLSGKVRREGGGGVFFFSLSLLSYPHFLRTFNDRFRTGTDTENPTV